MALLVLVTLIGCAVDNDDSDAFPSEQSISVLAAAYEDSADIDLFIQKTQDDNFVALHNGNHIPPGEIKLGLTVHGGAPPYGDVFVSKGGDSRTRAMLEDNYYTCGYNINSGDMIQVILVEVMHPNGTASKKKIVLRTDPLISDHTIINDGLGMLLSAGLLDRLKAILPAMIPLENIPFKVNSLRPASPSAREKGAIVYVDLDLFRIPVFANVGLEKDMEIDVIPNLEMTLIDAVVGNGIFSLKLPNRLLDLLNNYLLEMPPFDVAFDDLLSRLEAENSGNFIPAWMMDVLVNGDFIDFQNKHMEFGAYGLPEQTNNNAVAIGGWFLPLDNAVDVQGNDFMRQGIDESPALDPDALKGDLGLNLSQHGINQAVNLLVREGRIKMDPELMRGVFPDLLWEMMRGNLFDIWLSFNPSGIGLEMQPSSQCLTANDVRVTFEQNGAAVWQLSLDMQLTFDFQVHKKMVETENSDIEEHTLLDIYLTMIPEKSHCHEMFDSLGMGMVDHTRILLIIFEEMQKTLGAGPDGLFFSLDLSKMGVELDQVIASSEDGRCFLDVAIGDGMDLQLIADYFRALIWP